MPGLPHPHFLLPERGARRWGQEGAVPEGSGPGLRSAASSGLWSLTSWHVSEGGSGRRVTTGPASPCVVPVTPEIGILLPRGLSTPRVSQGRGRGHPTFLWGPGLCFLFGPHLHAALDPRKGRVKALPKRRGKEEDKARTGRPQKGRTERTGTKPAPAGPPLPQETWQGPHKPARPVGVSGRLTAVGSLRSQGRGPARSCWRQLPAGSVSLDILASVSQLNATHPISPFPSSLTPAQGGPPSSRHRRGERGEGDVLSMPHSLPCVGSKTRAGGEQSQGLGVPAEASDALDGTSRRSCRRYEHEDDKPHP